MNWGDQLRSREQFEPGCGQYGHAQSGLSRGTPGYQPDARRADRPVAISSQ
jgi:hypothetical protein